MSRRSVSAISYGNCNEQRCARWLLMALDRIQSDTMPITHDFLSSMRGSRRPRGECLRVLPHRCLRHGTNRMQHGGKPCRNQRNAPCATPRTSTSLAPTCAGPTRAAAAIAAVVLAPAISRRRGRCAAIAPRDACEASPSTSETPHRRRRAREQPVQG
jgi:hypothetical protein